MNEKEPKSFEPQRKTYSKPEIERIQLKPEECLVGGCKVSTETAAVSSQCILEGCFPAGS